MQQPPAPTIYQRHCIEEAKKAQEIAPRQSGALTLYATGQPPVSSSTIWKPYRFFCEPLRRRTPGQLPFSSTHSMPTSLGQVSLRAASQTHTRLNDRIRHWPFRNKIASSTPKNCNPYPTAIPFNGYRSDLSLGIAGRTTTCSPAQTDTAIVPPSKDLNVKSCQK